VTEFNLADAIEAVASAVPDRDAVIRRGRHLSYAELDERANRFANYLLDHGLTVHRERDDLAGHESGQDHVAQYLRNGTEYLETMLGAYKARVAPFNVNYRYVEEELLYLLNDARPGLIVFHAEFAPTLAAVLGQVDQSPLLVQVADDSGNELLPGAVDYETVLATASPERPDIKRSPDDLYLLYTGGTTGMPKGVLWRQGDFFEAVMRGRPVFGGDRYESTDDIAAAAVANGGVMRTIVIAPLMHGAAQWGALIGFVNGGTSVLPSIVSHLDPADVWRTIEQEKVVSVSVVGDAMARPLVDELEAGDYDTSSLGAFSNGGAVLNAGLKDRILELLPNIMILDAVGSSETGFNSTSASAAGSKATTGTFPLEAGTVVVDESMSHLLEPGHEGIGWMARQASVPLGYLGDEAKTARTFPVIDGVRYSIPGDRARLLADGTMELLGRDAVTINSGGEKIFAEEVEQALAHHPSVYDVVVVGRPSERWGNEVVAIVVLREGHVVTDDDLLEECGRHIARYKFPKFFVYLPELVRSPAGKADYRWARERAIEQGARASE